MLINISSGFFHSRQFFFRIFQLRTWKITVSALTSVNFHGSFWNVVRIFIALRSRTISIMEVLPYHLITEVKRCCPGAVVTINTLPPRRRDMRLNDKIQQLNDYIRSRASQGDGVRCHDDHPRFPDCFSNDRVHFNKAGKSVYARQLANYYVNFPPLFISEPR